MADDVEFWDGDTEGIEGLDLEWGYGDVFQETFRQLLAPLAADVVCDDDVSGASCDIICEGS